MKRLASIIVAGTVATTASATAQSNAARAATEQRYQIGQMEQVVDSAVEHGLTNTRERIQARAQSPVDFLVSDNAHARGFRIEGYGVFVDVVVPSFFTTTLTWSLRTLDQNGLGLDSALRTLQAHVKGDGDPGLEQALKRLELQMNPAVLARASAPAERGARDATGSTSATTDGQPGSKDPILSDPKQAYRTEVLEALKDVMLAHSRSLGIGPNEWLTIAAQGNDDRPRLVAADTPGPSTRIIRLRGSDLGEFLAGRITRDEVLKRIETMVF